MAEASTTAGTEERTDGPLVGAARKVERGYEAAKDRISGAAGTAREKFGEMQGRSFGDVVDSTKDFARTHPGSTILISLGVGALIGFLVRRR